MKDSLKDLIISQDKSIVQAMKQLDKAGKRILLVVDQQFKLIATVTDGDIRRWILKTGNLSGTVADVMNASPKSASIHEAHNATVLMKQHQIQSIPIIDDEECVVDLVLWNEISAYESTRDKASTLDIPVVIMAGGQGTRLYPYTKVLPKPLIPIGDLPIVEHIMNKFMEFGCYDFHYIVNHKKQMIKAYFSEAENKYSVSFYDEDTPLGTGGGLSLLKGKISGTFMLTNCDIILRADYNDIFEFHKQSKNIITMVCAYKHFTIPYGVITMGENGEIMHMTEKPEYSFLTNTGFYIVEPEVLEDIEENVAISFPDIIEKQRAKNRKVSIYPVSEKSCLDMGQLNEMEEMRKELGV